MICTIIKTHMEGEKFYDKVVYGIAFIVTVYVLFYVSSRVNDHEMSISIVSIIRTGKELMKRESKKNSFVLYFISATLLIAGCIIVARSLYKSIVMLVNQIRSLFLIKDIEFDFIEKYDKGLLK